VNLRQVSWTRHRFSEHVNQPIAGVVTNGSACLHWLPRIKGESADLAEARQAIQRIIRDGTRAGEVIARIRTLLKKADDDEDD
jgi:hypothetical protein